MEVRRLFNFFFQGHAIVASLILVFTLVWNSKLHDSTDSFDKRTSFNASYQFTAPFIRLVSGGYWVAAADYLWIESIAQIGNGKYSSETQRLSYDYYKLGIDLDPDFYELYEQSGILFSFFHKAPDAAIEFLTLGIRRYESGMVPQAYWTHPYSLYIYLAYVYAFQKNDWEKARGIYLRAAEVPGAPNYLSSMKIWLQDRASVDVLAVKVLKVLIRNTSDERIRAEYEKKLKEYER